MSYEEIIQEMRARPVNVCFTDILVSLSDHRYPWEAKFQSRHWDKLIAQAKFKSFATTANIIYKEMDRGRQYFPTVTFANNQLVLVYSDDSVVVKWTVDEDGLFSFILSHDGQKLRLNITKLESLARFACDFLAGDIAILKGNYVISN